MKTFNDWFPSTATYYKPGEMVKIQPLDTWNPQREKEINNIVSVF